MVQNNYIVENNYFILICGILYKFNINQIVDYFEYRKFDFQI